MHLKGVDKIPSRQQVDTIPEDSMIQGLHITVSCPGHRTKFERSMKKWTPNCTNTKTAGLHAFRNGIPIAPTPRLPDCMRSEMASQLHQHQDCRIACVQKWHPNCTNTKTAGLHAFRNGIPIAPTPRLPE